MAKATTTAEITATATANALIAGAGFAPGSSYIRTIPGKGAHVFAFSYSSIPNTMGHPAATVIVSVATNTVHDSEGI
jgi:hypothetical protein